MAVVRKSAVSTTGNWFGRNSTPSNGKRRSMPLESTVGSASKLADEPLPVSSKRHRRSSKKLSVSATNALPEVAKQPVSQLKSQSNITTTQKNLKPGFGSLPVMPTSGAAPFWLLRLYTSHRYSSVVTFLLVSATLFVYGWTVYSQELWSQGYNRLQNLQLQERQLTTTNATLKNKMAEEAEQEAAGLVSPTPARTIFLPTASPSDSSQATPPSTPPNLETQQNTPSPLGY
ncbi:hypothetical protein [Nodularia spumigena]|uniref:Cell division protein FtsL n=1 Tax=Nodularia spumigena CENA596 TaxID=1819295 RepID=A0A166IVI1_NODSP|nr:hypothetical protein [Nodularia spumigena]KZL48902.1 hypothetical protein A2T98_15510 [Nodularia spumigena CENA596]MDB9306924.1 hypothetical protein [Nodularia spumigena CS-591/12]MDB9318674.1 hypothetical protein [Nodularia spumigena CS-590/01A]MDB9322923.1 hypothetical protein [Nodularia spumigena CS-591/07A]MDB9327975.1 hypothetical protein [Nodularia spumigena CS-590/02]